MERSNSNRRGGGAGRGRGGGKSVSGGGRDGSGGGRGGYGVRAGNNYQQYHRQYQTDGADGGRRGGWGGRNRNQMGPNPSPAQPWGYQGSQGPTQRPQFAMGRCKVFLLQLIIVFMLVSMGFLWLSQSLQIGMGQGAGVTGGTGVWSGGPPHHVAGRGSSAPTVGGGAVAGHGQAPGGILPLFLFLSLFLKLIYNLCSPFLHALSPSPFSQQFMMLPLLPVADEWRCSLLLQLHHHLLSHHHRLYMKLNWTISST